MNPLHCHLPPPPPKKDFLPKKQDPYNVVFKGHRLDPYVILGLYKISDPCQQHAIKKLLRAGKSHKPLLQEIDEVIWTLNRMKEIINDDPTKTISDDEEKFERKVALGIV